MAVLIYKQIVVTFAEEVEKDYLAMGQDVEFASGKWDQYSLQDLVC